MERKRAMAYPTFHSAGHASAPGATPGHQAPTSAHGPAHPRRVPSTSPNEGEHQLEKLEFALAVALTRGDLPRSQQLREAIAALGGNQEEPGT